MIASGDHGRGDHHLTTAISSWREYDDAVADISTVGPDRTRAHASLVFRGLSRSSYSNATSLARLGVRSAQMERHLLRNFRKYAHRERPGVTIWDWLSLAQHHGLPTRLLDWTFSPLVAAHFATATYPGEEAVVWAVDCEAAHRRLPSVLRDALADEGATVFTTELLATHAPTLDAFDRLESQTPFALFFEPPSLDDRIVNQSAVLSVMPGAASSPDDWLRAHAEDRHRWLISPAAKAEIRDRLDQANITERVLIPGLDGLAAWLRRYYGPTQGGRDSQQEGAAMAGELASQPGQGDPT